MWASPLSWVFGGTGSILGALLSWSDPAVPTWGFSGVFPPYLDGGATVGDREAEHDEGLGHVAGLTSRLAAGQPHGVQVVRQGHHSPRHHQDKVSLQQALHSGCDTTERLHHSEHPLPALGRDFLGHALRVSYRYSRNSRVWCGPCRRSSIPPAGTHPVPVEPRTASGPPAPGTALGSAAFLEGSREGTQQECGLKKHLEAVSLCPSIPSSCLTCPWRGVEERCGLQQAGLGVNSRMQQSRLGLSLESRADETWPG